MQTNTKAFTLVEMLVAMAVSTIIIAATYASYDLVATQYKKNIDVAEMHTSGRAVMQMIERDIRMAGFEYRDNDAKITYGSITGPLVIKDSGEKCCDEVTVIYDYYDEDSKKAERIRITYSSGPHPRNKGGGDKYDRYRLYKKIDVLGKNNTILTNPIIGSKDLLADFVEDFQIVNISTTSSLFSGSYGTNTISIWDPTKPRDKKSVGYIRNSGYADALAFGPDGLLYSGSHGTNTISIWDPTKPRDKKSVGYIRNSGYADALAFGPDGLLYSGSYGTNTISIWDPTKPRDKKSVGYIRNSGYADALAFGPDGLLYSGSHGTNTISIWDPTKPRDKKSVGYIRNSGYADALAFKIKRTGQESLVTINLTLRTRNLYGKNKQFKKKDYHGGNFKFDKNDKYKRDTFSSTVLVRNMAL